MSIIGLGTDIVECARIGEVIERHGPRFYERILTPVERTYAERLRNSTPHIAGRFAAKEAILKVLGTGWRGQIAWTDMEIVNDNAGAPHVTLSGECARIASGLGIGRVLLTISHTDAYATATAIGVA
jgi:holo-[acyl-carrier protein] synthase